MSTPSNSPKKEGTKVDPSQLPNPKANEIKTDGPLSEKDEVKKAEENTNKPLKK